MKNGVRCGKDVQEERNKAMQEQIEKYDGSQIQVLEGLEAVRKRPGMYIGSTSSMGLHHLVYEIVDNSIDEALAGFCTHIEITIEADNSITVTDNGRGIPVSIQPQTGLPAVEVVFTVLHAGGKFGGGGYKVSGGLHGVGASVVNALSESLEVNVYTDGEEYHQAYARGAVTAPLEKLGKTEKRGTRVHFKPDPEIFEDLIYDYEVLLRRMREQAFLNGGVKITLEDKREEGRRDVLLYEGGIRQFVEHLNKNKTPLHENVIYIEADEEVRSAQIALQYTDSYAETVISFANDIKTTEGGMHETGFRAGLTKVLNDYARKIKVLKDSDANLSGEDVREGVTAIISVKLQEAQFEGQTKTKLGNSEMRTLVERLINEKLATFLEENPTVGRVIIEKALASSRAREAARRARDNERKKSGLESLSLPGKLADCSSRDNTFTEVYIVEGDSAGGSAKQGRDRKFQAILPLWGKMLNVEKSRIDKVIGNDKLTPVITAIGAGIGDDFNIEKVRYGKIIIMADADVDGSHIRTLLLTFFFRFMRPLIDNGRIYLAQPPLYKVFKGKKEKYAYNDEELALALQEIGSDATVQRYKGLGEMNAEQLWETTMNPETRTLVKVTLEDAVAADEIFTILMGDKVEPRRDYIIEHARSVRNLDI